MLTGVSMKTPDANRESTQTKRRKQRVADATRELTHRPEKHQSKTYDDAAKFAQKIVA